MTQSSTQPTAAAAPAVPRNGFGVTALVLALVGLVLGLVPFTGFLALILGMLAVLFGLLGWSRTRQGVATNRKMTVVGTVLGVGAAALGIWGMTIVFGAVDQLGKDLGKAAEDIDENLGNDPAALRDVTVSDCAVSRQYSFATSQATVTIKNSTGKTQSYVSTISVNDASGSRVGEINAVSNSLAAGQSVTLSGASATGTAASNAKAGPATCAVASVNRFPG